jgi:hypothetical protein
MENLKLRAMALNLKTGIIRARYRNSLSASEFLTAREVYQFDIRFGATSDPVGMTAAMVMAEEQVLHDRDHQSCLILPVIPRKQGHPNL